MTQTKYISLSNTKFAVIKAVAKKISLSKLSKINSKKITINV